jgi:16S rRNA (adenine1518-N6/adenine1519-N6)-dimethyltransferase
LLLNQTKGELRRLGLHARKGLGQHFLVDKRALHKVIAAAELTQTDTVVEVGPGLGILTRELAKKAGRVIAVEIDMRMVNALKESLSGFSNVDIINADVLECTPTSLMDVDSPYKVVGALPYNIASAVLRHFLEVHRKPQMVVAVLQREVAQAIVASPGDMSLLSVGVQFYGAAKIVGYISPSSFYPRPKVESAVVKIDVYDRPLLEVADEASFFRVVRGGFAAPRKQLRNSLAQGLGVAPSDILDILDGVGVDHQRRAQTLSLDEWAKLHRALVGKI